jgi:hypothetical protein
MAPIVAIGVRAPSLLCPSREVRDGAAAFEAGAGRHGFVHGGHDYNSVGSLVPSSSSPKTLPIFKLKFPARRDTIWPICPGSVEIAA